MRFGLVILGVLAATQVMAMPNNLSNQESIAIKDGESRRVRGFEGTEKVDESLYCFSANSRELALVVADGAQNTRSNFVVYSLKEKPLYTEMRQTFHCADFSKTVVIMQNK